MCVYRSLVASASRNVSSAVADGFSAREVFHFLPRDVEEVKTSEGEHAKKTNEEEKRKG